MAFCGEVDYAVDLILPDDASHLVEVCYVGLDEGIVGSVLDVTEVGEVAGIGQLVEVDDTVVGIFVYEEADYMGADESGAACYEDVLHNLDGFILNRLHADARAVRPYKVIGDSLCTF